MTAQHSVADWQHAPFFNSAKDVGNCFDREYKSPPTLIARMVRKMNRVHRPDLNAQPLQGKHCCRVACVSVSHTGLNGKDVQSHGSEDSSLYLARRKDVSPDIAWRLPPCNIRARDRSDKM